MGFRQSFAKKKKKRPGESSLPGQFCSDDRSLRVGLCPSASPGSSPSLSAQSTQGPEPQRGRITERVLLLQVGRETPKEAALPPVPVAEQQPSEKGRRRVLARTELQHHHLPLAADLSAAHGGPHTCVSAGRGVLEVQNGQSSKGQQCPPPRKIPAT